MLRWFLFSVFSSSITGFSLSFSSHFLASSFASLFSCSSLSLGFLSLFGFSLFFFRFLFACISVLGLFGLALWSRFSVLSPSLFFFSFFACFSLLPFCHSFFGSLGFSLSFSSSVSLRLLLSFFFSFFFSPPFLYTSAVQLSSASGSLSLVLPSTPPTFPISFLRLQPLWSQYFFLLLRSPSASFLRFLSISSLFCSLGSLSLSLSYLFSVITGLPLCFGFAFVCSILFVCSGGVFCVPERVGSPIFVFCDSVEGCSDVCLFLLWGNLSLFFVLFLGFFAVRSSSCLSFLIRCFVLASQLRYFSCHSLTLRLCLALFPFLVFREVFHFGRLPVCLVVVRYSLGVYLSCLPPSILLASLLSLLSVLWLSWSFFSFLSLPLAPVCFVFSLPSALLHHCGGSSLRLFRVSGLASLGCSASAFPGFSFLFFVVFLHRFPLFLTCWGPLHGVPVSLFVGRLLRCFFGSFRIVSFVGASLSPLLLPMAISVPLFPALFSFAFSHLASASSFLVLPVL